MSNGSISGAELAQAVPLVVRVEHGALEVGAAEWATLEPGDVLTLGKPVASSVQLRIGGRVVARGELVSVEGELGVRILALEPGA